MSSRATYHFASRWTLPVARAQVRDVLSDLQRYPEWWPQVRAVDQTGPDDARMLCRSTLPYTLDLRLHAVRRAPDLLESAVSGDLAGVVRWRLDEQGPATRVDFSQEVEATGRVLGLASYVGRPVLRWNHDQMMAGCLAGLCRELAR